MAATLVQSKSKDYVSGSSTTLTLDSLPTTGNVLILTWGHSGTSSDAATPTGGGVTTWTKDAESTARRSSSIWSGVVDTTPSANVVMSGTVAMQFSVSEWSGLDSGGTLVQGFSIKNAQGTVASGANCSHTPTSSSDVVLIYVDGQQSNSSTGPSAGWTALTAAGGIGPSAYQIVTAASGAYSNKFSVVNNYVAWDACIVAYNVASGGGSYSLTADSGTFTETGTAANLEFGRTVAAASGTYTLTGTAANLEFGREVAAASGTFALTGTDATLTYGTVGGYTLAANGTSYTLTGTAANLEFGRAVAAGAGTYALTGTAASLECGRLVSAGSGAFALTGTAATLIYGQPGAYTLAANGTSYAVTGTAATLTCGRRITAAGATYALTGTAAGLRATRTIAAASGTYALTGSDATLNYSAAVIVSSAFYVTTRSGLRYAVTARSEPRYRVTRRE